MNILVTGGGGYKGSILIPKLLKLGFKVTVLDLFWFGNYLNQSKNLTIINEDIRNIKKVDLSNFNLIIHLASIANDPCSNLNPALTWDISCHGTSELLDAAVKSNIPRIIYASSGSVYGVKEEKDVTEELELLPISAYNKAKIAAERIILSHKNDINVQIIRPATVCGLAPRMRLDLAVNLLTMQALKKKKITVLGGNQMRPNIHVQDLCDLYIYLIEKPSLTGIFNAGFENISIINMAKKISKRIGSVIEVEPSNDPRSYSLCSKKLLSNGFKPKYDIEHAIDEITYAYNQKKLNEDPIFYNVKWMQSEILSKFSNVA